MNATLFRMRAPLLPIALLLVASPLRAQLTAGEVPPGAVAYDLDYSLSPTQPFTADSVDIELDCDDFPDLRAVLYRGAPEIDAPNVAQLHFLDNDIQLCMDMPPVLQSRPRYYAFGEPLACTGAFDWQLSAQPVLGDFGGFFTMGPDTVDSLYIAFRRGSELGWMLLSFRINGNPEVRLTIHRLLPLCQGPTSVADRAAGGALLLHPNPSQEGTVRLTNAEDVRQLTVFDATGRVVARFAGPVRSIGAPEAPGTYLVRAEWMDGRTSTTKLVRY